MQHHATSALQNHTNSIIEHPLVKYPPRRLLIDGDMPARAQHGLSLTYHGHAVWIS